MYLAVLRLELLKMSPEAKYFLMAFIREFGAEAPVKKSVKELSALLKVPASVVTKATLYLTKAGLFFKVKHLPVPGRPRWNYGCTDKLIAMLDQGDMDDCSHALKIDRIFDKSKSQCPQGDLENLTMSNKLLLVVMLANADEGGVVRGLGRSDLRKLTGMSDERLKAQIDKLLDQELIRSAIPGTTNDLFGVCTGVYFLNLARFELATLSSGVLVYKEHQGSVALVESFFQQLVSYHKINVPSLQAERRCQDLVAEFGISVECIELIADSFAQGPKATFKRYMSFKINEYSSFILTKYWDTLSEEHRAYEDLVSIIRSDVKIFNSSDSSSLEDFGDAIVSFLEQSSIRVAKIVYAFQKRISNIDWGGMNQVILPDTGHYGAIVVELHPKENGRSPQVWFLFSNEPKQEKDIPCSQKHFFGLCRSRETG